MTTGKTNSKPARFRELLESPKMLVMPGVYDCVSCRVVQALGFQSAIISGAGISESRIGLPDIGVLSLEDNLAATRAISGSVEIPLLVDGETGYGKALNTHYAVQQFERAGAGAIMIEDQVWPQPTIASMELVPPAEMVKKVRAALDARSDPNLVIFARTDSSDPEDAIRRANIYAEAGADAIFTTRAVPTNAAIERFVKAVPKPVMINVSLGIMQRPGRPVASPRQIEELGVAVMMVARILSTASIRGMTNALGALKESLDTGEAVNRPELLAPLDELDRLMGIAELRALEGQYESS